MNFTSWLKNTFPLFFRRHKKKRIQRPMPEEDQLTLSFEDDSIQETETPELENPFTLGYTENDDSYTKFSGKVNNEESLSVKTPVQKAEEELDELQGQLEQLIEQEENTFIHAVDEESNIIIHGNDIIYTPDKENLSNVIASNDGSIVFSGVDRAGQITTVIKHKNGKFSHYSNLEVLTAQLGEDVERGEVLGTTRYAPICFYIGSHLWLHDINTAQMMSQGQ